MSKHAFRAVVLVAVIGLLGVVSYAIAGPGGGPHELKEVTLNGYEENPDISTAGWGSFEAEIAKDEQSIEYTLSYSALEGNITQSHIHFGKRAVNGGISMFLCSNLGNGPAGTPACPGTTSGTVTGVLTAANVVGPNGGATPQGIEPGALAEAIAAIRAGHAYANVHTSKWAGGEVRAQINDKDGKNSND